MLMKLLKRSVVYTAGEHLLDIKAPNITATAYCRQNSSLSL